MQSRSSSFRFMLWTSAGLLLALVSGCGGGSSSSGSDTVANGGGVNVTPLPVPVAVPAALASVSAVTFASTEIGSLSTMQSIKIINTGTADLTLSSDASIDKTAFKLAAGTCKSGKVIRPNETCSVDILFNPANYTSIGAVKGTLTFKHNAAPAQTTVAVSGAGVLTLQKNIGNFQRATANDCARLLSTTLPTPVISTTDMQAVSDILKANSPSHGYPIFARLPDMFMRFVRGSAPVFTVQTIGISVHEVNHNLDQALQGVCVTNGDYTARYFQNGTTHPIGLRYSVGQTPPYGIVQQTIPEAAKTSIRYQGYILDNGQQFGQQSLWDFTVLLEELNAYTGAADFEVRLLLNPDSLSVAHSLSNNDPAGMVDFMVYLTSYLKAARLSYPDAYTTIKSDAATIKFIQTIWSRAEGILLMAYPLTQQTGATYMFDNRVVMEAAYSADLLAELDAIGVEHLPSTAWANSYLKPK